MKFYMKKHRTHNNNAFQLVIRELKYIARSSGGFLMWDGSLRNYNVRDYQMERYCELRIIKIRVK
jgi:hypothetical protein